ncbi:MAG: hypothetical protein PCFJNLEI_02367 [Verrucomicrobiae bacterium]|nr:hypothetical protein [Verrucomicrobiae bacterium]
MSQKCNLIGRNVSRERYQRGWSQEELVTKVTLLGCYMTRDILASIETLRCVASDKHVAIFAAVFDMPIEKLFPPNPHLLCKEPDREPQRRRHKPKTRRRKK